MNGEKKQAAPAATRVWNQRNKAALAANNRQAAACTIMPVAPCQQSLPINVMSYVPHYKEVMSSMRQEANTNIAVLSPRTAHRSCDLTTKKLSRSGEL